MRYNASTRTDSLSFACVQIVLVDTTLIFPKVIFICWHASMYVCVHMYMYVTFHVILSLPLAQEPT